MTKVQYILNEINDLNTNDLELVFQEISKRVDQEKRIKSILEEYRGVGKGVWGVDAQVYINQERNKDRV